MGCPDWVKIPVVAIAKWGSFMSLATIAVALPLLGLRYLGGLEPLELAAFDQFVRLRPSSTEPDPRLLVVAITEDDIDKQQQ